ncbi:helix-turn-helix transcriptional regulator [Ruania halotolerans]|uniref:helix-turn-helix transcriptional regulator n=1 Tax=Ruania halotolerans TaxID=2897773 RepID=UPI001E636733|nr:HTH domain-containing protein [Ruania halotolerans]UFU08388.1 HTH domain-containing protein [Ruania halotolerans]
MEDSEATTRDRVRELIIEFGPITAADMADRLDLTSAAVRRHLAGLERAGQITVREDTTSTPRGRGRPAKRYIATPAAHPPAGEAYARLAVLALTQLGAEVGPEAIEEFARMRSDELAARYRAVVEAAGDDVHARAEALATALSQDGYAATSRPIGVTDTIAVQLCQGHCPVQQIAAQFPQLCEAETQAFSDLLGVHVQRLATLAGGEHVCTTHIPVTIPTRAEGMRVRP